MTIAEKAEENEKATVALIARLSKIPGVKVERMPSIARFRTEMDISILPEDLEKTEYAIYDAEAETHREFPDACFDNEVR